MREQLAKYVVGVDVGTGSARAGIFDLLGHRLAMASEPIQLWTPQPEWAEQSSEDIWRAVGATVRAAVLQAGIDPADVIGIGVDATCSLVVLDREDNPLAVSDGAPDERNVIVWMDHRALGEAEEINAGGYDVLRYVGGKISPEMQTPKLKWLKTNLPETWDRAGKFLDLADFLTYRSTGRDIRSLCTNVCKWTYLGQEGRWDKDYFSAIGIGDVFEHGRIGEDIRPQGTPVGPLTSDAAHHLGLSTGAIVSVGLIDAHAGGLGVLGAALAPQGDDDAIGPLEESLALIGGTSSCHMAVSPALRFIPGIWGPYWGAMVPQMWLTEGGQSATGALVDYTLQNHAYWPRLSAEASDSGRTVYEIVNAEVARLAAEQDLAFPALLTRDLHVLDYHLGNRSPLADPRAKGLVDGLTLDTSLASLAVLYLATIQSIAYGTRAIMEALNTGGYRITRLYAVGGGTKNPLWLSEHADITGAMLVLPEEPESVLLGSAILGAVASGVYPDILAAMRTMCRSASEVVPNPAAAEYHDAKYVLYRELYVQQRARREAMARF